MKKLTSILGVIAVAALMALTSCQNAESPLIGDWRITSAVWGGVEVNIQKLIESLKVIDPETAEELEGIASGTLSIAKNHTYTTKYTGAEGVETYSGTWSYSDGTLTLKPDDGEDSLIFTYADNKLSTVYETVTVYFTK